MKTYIKISLLFLLSSFAVSFLHAQEQVPTKTRILFIFDGSNSMNAQWEKGTKIKIAKRLLTQTLDSLKGIENIEIGLRMYGHQTRIIPGHQDCSDTKLEVPLASGDANIVRIQSKIRGLQPKGTTPIARSLEYAAQDFPDCNNCRNVIILISDGIEACDEDPCAVSRALREKGIKLQPFIIGLGLDTSYLSQFECIGEFMSAETEDSFQSVLNFVVSQALNNTTAQINLLNTKGEAKETDVTMSIYNQKNGKLMHTYMHTINRKQVPDTISLNPLYTYKVVVHTTPEKIKENIKLKAGIHNTIVMDAPQGSLSLKIQGSDSKFTNINCIVRKQGDLNTLNIQPINYEHKYIVGTYDLEILTLPRVYITDVKINQSRITPITIPQNGILEMSKGAGPCAIFLIKNGKNNWVCNISEQAGNFAYKLQPGKYRVIYRSEKSMNTAHTIEKEIKISPSLTERITF